MPVAQNTNHATQCQCLSPFRTFPAALSELAYRLSFARASFSHHCFAFFQPNSQWRRSACLLACLLAYSLSSHASSQTTSPTTARFQESWTTWRSLPEWKKAGETDTTFSRQARLSNAPPREQQTNNITTAPHRPWRTCRTPTWSRR